MDFKRFTAFTFPVSFDCIFMKLSVILDKLDLIFLNDLLYFDVTISLTRQVLGEFYFGICWCSQNKAADVCVVLNRCISLVFIADENLYFYCLSYFV